MSEEEAEQFAVRHALARGFVTKEHVRRAVARVEELRRAGRTETLLGVLRAQLPPACLPELNDVHERARSAPLASTFDGAATQPGTHPAPSERLRAAAPSERLGAAAPTAAGRRALVEAYRAELARDPHFAPHADLVLEPLGELGRGGMGVVHRVRDRRLGREAAMKVILGSATPRQVQRFLREARITAGLDHPAIPPVHEAGTDAAGRHYMLMRVIRGRSLSEAIEIFRGSSRRGASADTSTAETSDMSTRGESRDGRGASAEGHRAGMFCAASGHPVKLSDLLEALLKVSEAVAYAHSKGVVHRDLKPANVMVGSFGEVMLMDWGVARELAGPDEPDAPQENDTAALELTQEGALVGTLGYMPPEQAQGRPVDARADVYALGAILVELLTGRPPVTGKDALSMIRNTVEGRLQLPRDRCRDVPAELHDLATQALAQDPAARPDAAGFAADLRAYLAGGEVRAHRYGLVERVLRAARRHPTRVVAGAALVTVIAVVSVAVARTRTLAAESSRHAAESAAAAADARRSEAERREADVRRERAEAEQRRAEADRARAEAEAAQAAAAVERDRQRERARFLLGSAEEALSAGEFREAAILAATSAVHDDIPTARAVWFRAAQGPWLAPRTFGSHRAPVSGFAFTPDGRRLVSHGWEGDLKVWEVETGTCRATVTLSPRRAFPTGARSRGPTVAMSAAPPYRVAVAVDSLARVWDVETGSLVRELSFEGQSNAYPLQVALSPSGDQLVVVRAAIEVWDLRRGALVRSIGLEAGDQVLLCGATRYAVQRGGELILKALETGLEVARAPRTSASSMSGFGMDACFAPGWSRDGRITVVGLGGFTQDEHLAWWWPDANEVFALHGRGELPTAVACSADGQTLASVHPGESVLRVWDDRHALATLRTADGAGAVAVSPDGSCIAFGDGKAVRTWMVRVGAPAPQLWAQGVAELDLCSQERVVAQGIEDRRLRVWDLMTGRVVAERPATDQVNSLRFTDQGRVVAWLVGDQQLRLWRIEGDRETVVAIGGRVLAFSPDAKMIAVGDDTAVRIVAATTGALLRLLPVANASLGCFSASGELVVCSQERGSFMLSGWHDARRRWQTPLTHLTDGVETPTRALIASPDGRAVACLVHDGVVLVDTATGRRLGRFQGRRGQLLPWPPAFAPDGRRFAVACQRTPGSDDADAIVCDASSGRQLLCVPAGENTRCVAFDQRGETLVLASFDGNVRRIPVALLLGGERTADELLRETEARTGLHVPDGALVPVAAETPR